MNTSAPLARRTVLTASAAGVGAIALAACSSNSTKTAANDANTSGATAAASANGSSASSGGSPLIKLESIAVGSSASVKLPNGKPGIVARPTADTTVGFSAICTHMGCTVNPAGNQLHCPCHGSKYNAFTGAVIAGPAPHSLAKVEVHVAGGEVLSGT